MNKYRSAALVLATCAASLALAACSAGTPTASSASSPAVSSSAAGQGLTESPPPTTGAPIPGRMLTVNRALGTFPIPAAAKIGENMSAGQGVIVAFGLIVPADVARFYATALPQAGFTVTTDSMVSKGNQHGALIIFTGHGYKGNIESVNQEAGYTFAGLGAQNVTTIIMSPTQ
jgi:hypothetical protein